MVGYVVSPPKRLIHEVGAWSPAGDAILGSSGNLVDLARGSRSVGMGP